MYGAYLKHYTTRSKLGIRFDFELAKMKRASVTHGCASDAVARANPEDVIYCDPPYNNRSYSKNYHVLNIIADTSCNAVLKGVTGLPAAP